MYKQLLDHHIEILKNNDFSLRLIYETMTSSFSNEVFCEILNDGKIVKTTYSELFDRVDTLSARLTELFDSSDSNCIGIFMDNSADWVACFWAVLKAGFSPLLLNLRQDTETTEKIVKMLKPACVIADNDRLSKSLSVSDILKISPAKASSREWSDEVILITSGSTAFPKIVYHNGQSICSQVTVTAEIIKENPTITYNRKAEIKILAFLPFYHIFGLVATLMWFSFFGRTIVFLNDYSPKKIQYTCQRHGVTNFFAIPLVWEKSVASLLAEVEKAGKTKSFMKLIDFSNALQTAFPHVAPPLLRKTVFKGIQKKMFGTHLTFCISGGGFISDKTIKVLNGIGYSLYPGYGLTECGIISVNLDRRANKRTALDCGKIFSNITYRTDDNGELEIYNNHCFNRVLANGILSKNENEYYCTGDKVEFNSAGHLQILGRSDEIIIGGNGENISPEAIERKLDFGEYANAGVLCIKDRIVVAVTAEANSTAFGRAVSQQKLFESIDKLPIHEKPTAVLCLNGEIPHTVKSTDRKKLATMIENHELQVSVLKRPSEQELSRCRSKAYDATLEQVKQLFASVTENKLSAVDDNTDFIGDLGGDSMEYLELVSNISEKFSVEIKFDSDTLLTPVKFTDYIVDANKNV